MRFQTKKRLKRRRRQENVICHEISRIRSYQGSSEETVVIISIIDGRELVKSIRGST
jgi:ribosomal protein L18E